MRKLRKLKSSPERLRGIEVGVSYSHWTGGNEGLWIADPATWMDGASA